VRRGDRSRPLRSPAILAVDDDRDMLETLADALSSLAEIDRATGGERALEMMRARKYDAVILDLHMDDLDGLGVLDSLAFKTGPNRDTPIIAVTVDTSPRARIEFLKRRAACVLSKPVPVAELVSRVRSTVGDAA
jgi:DNA-binding response OmpR family regulator